MKKSFYGILEIDRYLCQLEPTTRTGKKYYVEVGCADGLTQSNSYHLEKNHGFKGILIDANPEMISATRRNRSSKNNVVFNTAILSNYRNKKVKLMNLGLMSHLVIKDNEIANIKVYRDLARKYNSFGNSRSKKSYEVEVKTLDEVLRLSNSPKNMFLLSIDVEGTEMEVLKSIKFNGYSWDYILVEARDPKKVQEFLNIKKYNLLAKIGFNDFLFCKTSIVNKISALEAIAEAQATLFAELETAEMELKTIKVELDNVKSNKTKIYLTSLIRFIANLIR